MFKSSFIARNTRFCAALLLLLLLTDGRAQTTKLEAGWQFLHDPAGALKVADLASAQGWRAVRTGLSWNAQFADLRDYMGVAWYRTQIAAPDLSNGRRALLRFGAVDYYCEVFVNGRQVGAHEGGYTPFTLDITDALHAGANEVAVRVVDPPMDERENRARFPTMLYNEIPHGKQNWYVQTGGLWQPVWLEVKPKVYIKGIKVTTKVDGRMVVLVRMSELPAPPIPYGDPKRPSALAHGGAQTASAPLVRVIDPKGHELKLQPLDQAFDSYSYAGKIDAPMLWRPEQPNLYEVAASTADETVRDRFGFRQFEARDGKFYLNGQPFYMVAALDQDFYPETIYTPPSKEYVREQMLKGKRMGLNLLRCHIKVCDPTYLEAADEVGMLVWYEIPSWNDFNHFAPLAAARGETIFREMVDRDWNHPAIVIQSIINEGWGANLAKDAESRRWLRAAFDRARQTTAPLGRLIVDNSACCDNFHLKTDIEDNHRYNSIPDDYQPFDRWVADFAARPKWNFSPHGDAEPTGREPLVVSEFGNWGLPRLPQELPWWFGRGFGDRPVTRPAGLFERFAEFKFATLFPNYDALAEATQWHQFVSLKHEIEEIRRHASIQGYVITEFTDINWEANGLMSMWREPKAYAAELAKIQQPDVVIARTDKHNYTSGEPVNFEVLLSHYSERDLRGAQLIWHVEGGKPQSRQVIDQALAPAGVNTLARHSFPAPQVARPKVERILLEMRDRAGRLVAENTQEVFVFPQAQTHQGTDLIIYDPTNSAERLFQPLMGAGYTVFRTNSGDRLDGSNAQALVLATRLDDKLAAHVRAGGHVLLLANAADALPASAPFKVTPRAGSDLDGNWVTNFNWVRTDAPSPFSRVAFTRILGFESEYVVPRFVIQNVPGGAYGDVLAGVFYGWLNNNAAYAVQMRAGRGRLLVTTFRFDEYGRDPYSTHLLDALVAYAGGPDFTPQLVYEMTGATAR